MSGSAARFIWPNSFSVDATGVPRAGAQLFFYQTGTTTPQATYADSGLAIPNPNPVVADENGQFGNIFLLGSPSYAVALEDQAGNQVWTMDPVGAGGGGMGSVPVGAVADFAGAAAPAGWLLCCGQAISRTTWAALFAVIGTVFGAGDGATTFGLPDLRGRVTAGVDNMGGAAANLLTMAGAGVNGVQLGASGGSQMAPAHTHILTDPGHDHTLTDPGHVHDVSATGWGTSAGPDLPYVPAAYSSTAARNDPTSSVATGVTLASATTGITIASSGAGASQNVQPVTILNKIIYAGVGG
jgi:microcystin-dependent protein